MLIYEDLIGCDEANQSLKFKGQDSESLFKKNKARMPNHWLYLTEKISYDYNRLGHRCKNPEDIDFSNYCLFLGDSHTEGIGLALEKTYPYITTERLNMDYYNLGLGGTGIDYTFYNFNIWLTKFPKPKYVVIYYTDPARFMTQDDTQSINYTECGSWDDREYIKNFLVNGLESNYFNTKYKLTVNMIKNLLSYHTIPYSNISIVMDKLQSMDLKIIPRIRTSIARDCQHAGIEVHQYISDYLVNHYNDKYLNARFDNDIRGQKQS